MSLSVNKESFDPQSNYRAAYNLGIHQTLLYKESLKTAVPSQNKTKKISIKDSACVSLSSRAPPIKGRISDFDLNIIKLKCYLERSDLTFSQREELINSFRSNLFKNRPYFDWLRVFKLIPSHLHPYLFLFFEDEIHYGMRNMIHFRRENGVNEAIVGPFWRYNEDSYIEILSEVLISAQCNLYSEESDSRDIYNLSFNSRKIIKTVFQIAQTAKVAESVMIRFIEKVQPLNFIPVVNHISKFVDKNEFVVLIAECISKAKVDRLTFISNILIQHDISHTPFDFICYLWEPPFILNIQERLVVIKNLMTGIQDRFLLYLLEYGRPIGLILDAIASEGREFTKDFFNVLLTKIENFKINKPVNKLQCFLALCSYLPKEFGDICMLVEQCKDKLTNIQECYEHCFPDPYVTNGKFVDKLVTENQMSDVKTKNEFVLTHYGDIFFTINGLRLLHLFVPQNFTKIMLFRLEFIYFKNFNSSDELNQLLQNLSSAGLLDVFISEVTALERIKNIKAELDIHFFDLFFAENNHLIINFLGSIGYNWREKLYNHFKENNAFLDSTKFRVFETLKQHKLVAVWFTYLNGLDLNHVDTRVTVARIRRNYRKYAMTQSMSQIN